MYWQSILACDACVNFSCFSFAFRVVSWFSGAYVCVRVMCVRLFVPHCVGVPAVAISNFTFDFIYDALCPLRPAFGDYARRLRAEYAAATHAIGACGLFVARGAAAMPLAGALARRRDECARV